MPGTGNGGDTGPMGGVTSSDSGTGPPPEGGGALVREFARFPARPEGLAAVHAAFDRFFAAAASAGRPVGDDDRIALLTAAGEIAANIGRHACKDLPDASATLTLSLGGDGVEARFEDPGVPYVEKAPSEPDPLPQGGLGLLVARASLDVLEYARSGHTNCWRLVRHTSAPGAPS